jgi:predicted SnoaL-like aldol condensation-catalyzing enzyme
MDDTQNKENNARREFFSRFLNTKKEKKVKMLTPDGKLVEVDQSVINKAMNKKKVTSKDIYNWMENPSKES